MSGSLALFSVDLELSYNGKLQAFAIPFVITEDDLRQIPHTLGSMIKLDHVAVYVHDLEAMKDFYVTYFGASANEGYHNPKTGLRTYFLSFGGEARVEIMQRPGHDVAPDPQRTGWIHSAFTVGKREDVDALAARLAAHGFAITNGPRVTGDGYYEAVVIGPEGNDIEIIAD